MKTTRIALAALLLATALVSCIKEEPIEAPEPFSFVIYPGSRYLPQLTELTKQAHKVLDPGKGEAPATAIYDTDASVEDVANFYVKAYGYTEIANEAPAEGVGTRPAAYRRGGDLAYDTKAIEPLLQKMNVKADVSKATGTYQAVEIAPRPSRPRVTVQRPYFDVTTSQVVDKTLILMAR